DSSAEMLGHARIAYPHYKWIHCDITQWAAAATDSYDLVYSSAALQWVGDHAALYPRIFARVAPGGTLAIQVPYSWDEPFHRVLCDLQSSSTWRPRLPSAGVRARLGHSHEFYYDTLAPFASRITLWETRYVVALPAVESIVDWLQGTALR